MRKTICALTLTLILSGVTLAGEMPNGGTTPPPPPPPQGRTIGEMPNGQEITLQTSDETVADFILNLLENILTIY